MTVPSNAVPGGSEIDPLVPTEEGDSPIMTEPTIEFVNPNNLMLELNVRTEASVTKQLIESIKEHGVLTPITAVRDANGNVHVRTGQRRTLAAREAGLETIPVFITDAKQDLQTRVLQQITENDHRLQMTEVDRIHGIQQLLDTGMSVTRISKGLAIPADQVKRSKAAAGSRVAMEALQEQTVTLEEAATLAEFDGDEDAIARLINAAGRNWFDHEAERLRREREDEKRRVEAAVEWSKLGYTVLDGYPNYDGVNVPLHYLLTAGEDGELIEADESVVKDPTHWSIILDEEAIFVDGEGNPVDEEKIDWATEGAEDGVEAAEGMVHYDAITEKEVFVPRGYFCHDPVAAGLVVSEKYTKLSTAAASLGEGEVIESSADLAKKEAEKAERKRVITMNKAGDAAQAVRREFVQGLLKRKTLPEGAMLFVAEALARNGTLLGGYNATELTGELLGQPVREGGLLDHATDGRAGVVVLGMVLGAMESGTQKSAWRGTSQDSRDYLRFLEGQGYALSPVEKVVVGDMTVSAAMEHLV